VANRSGDDNAGRLRRLLDDGQLPSLVRRARESAGPVEWRNRAAMLFAANDYAIAFDDYSKSVSLDATDVNALDGLVRTAVAAEREDRALEIFRSSIRAHPQAPQVWIAMSRLLAATGSPDQAIAAAREACDIKPVDRAAFEQLASILADVGDAAALEPVVATLQQLAPGRATSRYYAAAGRFLRGEFPDALALAQQAITLDPNDARAHNLVGAIHATLGHRAQAREAFQTALRLNARDSATYVNLGLLELSSANRAAAAGDFAEALSLDPKSTAALQGLAQTRQ
jgi:tetratricopeptide (TPR) repeat protein